MARVLAAYVHVLGKNGEPVVLAPGRELPKWAKDQVTNPAAFVESDEDAPAATVVPEVVVETETPASPVDPAGTPDETVEADVVELEPEHELAYVERKFPSLQAAAKSRGLSGAGNTETLIARLEADDRDRAAQ